MRRRRVRALETIPSLGFNPEGVQRLAQVLDRSIDTDTNYGPQLRAADVAFFVADAHKNLVPAPVGGSFHRFFTEARMDTGTGDEARRVRSAFRDGVMCLGFDAVRAIA